MSLSTSPALSISSPPGRFHSPPQASPGLGTAPSPVPGAAITSEEVRGWTAAQVKAWALQVAGLGEPDAAVVGKYRGSLLLKLSPEAFKKLQFISDEARSRVEGAVLRGEWGLWPAS